MIDQTPSIRTRHPGDRLVPVDIVGGLFVVALAVLPVVELIVRTINGSGILWSLGVLQSLVIWVAMLGGVAASGNGSHLSMGTAERQGRGFWNVVDSGRNLAVISFNIAFCIISISFLFLGFTSVDRLGVIPLRLVLVIFPAGYLFMSLPRKRSVSWKYSAVTGGGIMLGLVLSWPSAVNLLSMIFPDIDPGMYDSVDLWYTVFRFLRWPLVLLLILFAIRGLPIFLILGGAALILFSGNWGALESLPNEAYNLLTGNLVPAIPLFTIAGFLLSQSSSGERMVRFFRAALGWLPGGLAIVAVAACAYFTTFTGASGITILALGGLLVKVLVDSDQYGRSFSQGLVTSSGSIGLLFPPALPIIMFGVTAQTSIKDMFLGGVIPGLLLVLALSAMGVSRAVRSGKSRTPFNPRELLRSVKESLGVLCLPVLILAVYFSGTANLVESSALAVVYVLGLLMVTGELGKSLIVNVLKRGIPVIGGVLVILAMAKGLSYFIVDANVPTMLTGFFREFVSSRFVFLILLNLVLLLTGTIMDIYSAILVVAPLIIPLGDLYGIHPVQLGIIFLANLQLGYLTPPVGMNLFLASYTFDVPVTQSYRQVIPFFLVLLVVVLLITYVPWFSLALLGT